ncbi:hypothetical protein EYF80_016747 [Liparis tanakae]|uniref:Uncharacterized protein n=1 Tax=Liparis tanakae TaxID=230148 RepID=A0A4Z2I4Y8_9TELE|nr:hypothetical protein EYF80_016747 [Liparis tanakae]
MADEEIKSVVPGSGMLTSGLVSVIGGGSGGSSEQLPGDRNSRTTLSTCGLKRWLTFGSTTWATILSTPCSSIPDLRGTDLTLGYFLVPSSLSCSSPLPPPSPSTTGGHCLGWKVTSKNSIWLSPRSILQLRTICISLSVQAQRHSPFRSFRRLAQSKPGPTSLPPRLSSSSPSHPEPSPREAICNW